MKDFKELLSRRKAEDLIKHPRFKYLDIFHKRLNLERIDTKYKPLSMRTVAIKTAHLSLEDMDYLLKRCQQSSNFSKVFFGALKVKRLSPGRAGQE